MAKRKTKKSIYHHLHLNKKGGMIYYDRRFGDQREHFSTLTKDWEQAAQVRDEFERVRGQAVGAAGAETLSAAAERYLEKGLRGKAGSTRHDLRLSLKPGGKILGPLGHLAVDRIEPALEGWWDELLERISKGTARNYINAIVSVLRFAKVKPNSAAEFRSALPRPTTKAERAAARPKALPFDGAREIAALLKVSEEIGGDGHVATVLMLDAGLRLGEVCGLRWSDVVLGVDRADKARFLEINVTLARGFHESTPKSGLSRTVALSQRLQALLRRHKLSQSGSPLRVLPDFKQDTYRKYHFRRACLRADLGHRRPKDLRDTYASMLLTAGVALGYISHQLGHADVAVTAKHYAKWTGGIDYHTPMVATADEHPADFLARLEHVSPQLSPQLDRHDTDESLKA